MSNEPNVRRVRDAIGADIADRLAAALGPDCSPEMLRTLNLVTPVHWCRPGMGNLEYCDLSGRMEEAAGVIFGGDRESRNIRRQDGPSDRRRVRPVLVRHPRGSLPDLRPAACRGSALPQRRDRGFYALSRHADVSTGFRDSARFSNTHGVSLEKSASGPNAAKTQSFLGMDPPEHTRMRALVSRGFTPRRVAQMEDQIRRITLEHLEPALERGEFDFVTDLAGKLPMDVVSELMGVPKADRTELRRNADLLLHREDGVYDVPPAGIEAAFTLAAYYMDLIADRDARRAATT